MLHDDLRSTTLLIVDDEPATIRLLERLLVPAGDADIRSTTDPRDAPALCRDVRPGLVLLDLRMPHLDGCAVTEVQCVVQRLVEP